MTFQASNHIFKIGYCCWLYLLTRNIRDLYQISRKYIKDEFNNLLLGKAVI